MTKQGKLIQHARELIGWSQDELRKRAKVGLGTVIRIEAGMPYKLGPNTPIDRIMRVLRKGWAVNEVELRETLRELEAEFLNHQEPGSRGRKQKSK